MDRVLTEVLSERSKLLLTVLARARATDAVGPVVAAAVAEEGLPVELCKNRHGLPVDLGSTTWQQRERAQNSEPSGRRSADQLQILGYIRARRTRPRPRSLSTSSVSSAPILTRMSLPRRTRRVWPSEPLTER